MASSSKGFTIIEISMFLAVSGLLILVVLLGTGNSIRSTRFSDSSQSARAYLQKQYDNILNGVNQRLGNEECNASIVDTSSAQAPGASNCLLMGRLISTSFNSSIINTYDIVGTEPANPNYNLSDTDLIKTFQPTIVRTVNSDAYQISWGAQLSGSKRLSDSKFVDQLAFIRSPRSTHIVAYSFKNTDLAGSNNLLNVVSDPNNIEKIVNFCISNSDGLGSPSKITHTGGQGHDSIQLSFDASLAGDCNGL